MKTRREFIQGIPATAGAFAVANQILTNTTPALAEPAPATKTTPFNRAPGHFDPDNGKAPSKFTREILERARETLPFNDKRDFEEVAKGHIADMEDLQILSDDGKRVVWDKEPFKFLNKEGDIKSIHPSLQRISRLNQNYGLYKVVDGIYQVRGFDLSDISFVRGKKGWIVIDPLISAEVARAAWKLFQKHVGEGLPISAVIYSHSHGDHWGGVRGLINESDVESGVEVIAPRDFMKYTISENVYAGNAMNRRLFYQYGTLLPVNPYGYAGQGLGQNTSSGAVGLIPPTRIVEKDIEGFEVDGVYMIHQNTPGTEAPSEMNTYLPEYKALWMAENVTATLHNIYTLRGALVRDPLRWSKYINEALYLFGADADVMFASHHWPRWGKDRILEVLRGQRDLYANMNNQVMHFANQGVTINQIHNEYKLPKSILDNWFCRGYHGSAEHNSRGVIQRFLGFWDCNPTTLIPLSPKDSAPLYVEMMGGAEKIMAKALELCSEGKYKHATEILDKLIHAEPENNDAKHLLADAFEQLGYQQENPGLRNSFLAGAYELRSGIPQGDFASSSSPDVVRAMSTEQYLNFLGIKMDSRKAEAEGLEFIIKLSTPDNGEEFIIEMKHATLTNIDMKKIAEIKPGNIKGYTVENPDLIITINRSDLEKTMIGEKTLEEQIKDGTAQVEGDVSILAQLAATMVEFNPRFEVLPGTASPAESDVAKHKPYEVVLMPIAE